MQVTSRVLLASFSVGAIQLLISLLSRNFTLPILSCILLTAIALFVTNDPLGSYLPFVTYTYIASIRPIEELTKYTTRDVEYNIMGCCNIAWLYVVYRLS